MKLYVYTDVEKLTDRWHHKGGLVIVTDRDPVAVYNEDLERRVLEDVKGFEWTEPEELAQNRATYLDQLRRTALPEPSQVYDIPEADTERVDVFPNAGCC